MKKPKNHRTPQADLFTSREHKNRPTIAELNARYASHLMRRQRAKKDEPDGK